VKKKVHRKKLKNGYLFWITGLSGSGKTTVAKKIKRDVEKLYGPTVVISGDEIRNIFLKFLVKRKTFIEGYLGKVYKN